MERAGGNRKTGSGKSEKGNGFPHFPFSVLPFTFLIFSISLLPFSISPLFAQTSGAAFLKIDPSPRSYALASADAVAVSGAQAIGQNPANIGLMSQKYEVFTSYETLLDGTQYGHAAVALNPSFLPDSLDSIDGLAFSITRL